MTFLEFLNNRMNTLGVQSKIIDDMIEVNDGKQTKNIRVDDQWEPVYAEYQYLRTKSFDTTSRILQINNRVEIQLTPLSQPFGLYSEYYEFSDTVGNTVRIGSNSIFYRISYFESTDYEKLFNDRYKNRIFNSSIRSKNLSSIIPNYITATYNHKGRKIPSNILEESISTINRCLFYVSVEIGESLVIYKPRKTRISQSVRLSVPTSVRDIPKPIYEENVVNYYKVAKASPFPSQSYLSYYHVIEYYFLKVSELKLHDRLAGLINAPTFQTNADKLEKVISTVRGQDAKNDETEMLRSVLDRYINEEELIQFITNLEKTCGEKLYTKRRLLFGEHLQINMLKDHALVNTATILKHIRNAIVHSSDRYNRDECHIPLTDSEDIIDEFIPIIRFLAEKVIYGNAK
jgi:hypothetical protein